MKWRIPEDYILRCYAGWLGKVIGVRHGAPIEGWTYEKINRRIGEITDYLVDYRDFAADDDTNGPICFVRALVDYGMEASSREMGLTWLNYAPYEHGFYWWGGYGVSTEHTAYLNMRAGIEAPESGSIRQNGKTVAEQIGGQIFCDCWGLIAPGNPELAADYAQRNARVSHDGNGVYGARFVAAAIAAAFVKRDIRQVIEAGLEQIPADCEYMRMAQDILAYYDAHDDGDWRDCMEHIIAHWGYDRYGGNCHIIPNSAVMIMAMLYGQGNYSRTINIGNMAGWDTDCNVGNIGTILGVMVGLDGIETRWCRPINDFLAISSVVGSLNNSNLPENVRLFCRLGYAMAGQDVPDKWKDFLEGRHMIDFSLPGSTCAMRLDGGSCDWIVHEKEIFESGLGALKCVFMPDGDFPENDRIRKIYYKTYYHPSDLHDNRYDPSFSPVLYPGQTIVARVMSDGDIPMKACAFVHDANGSHDLLGEAVILQNNQWTTIQMQIPAGSCALLDRAGIMVEPCGVSAEACLYVDWVDFGGKADYTLDFAREHMEVWSTNHREVSQLTYLKGLWTLEDGYLMGTCADYGEAYTGDVAWRDMHVETRFTRNSRGRAGFCFRTQGAVRGYAVLADDHGISLLKNSNGYTELARFEQATNREITLSVTCIGNDICVSLDGKDILAVQDDTYESGMVGFVLRDGGHAHYREMSVRTLSEVHSIHPAAAQD